MTNDGSPPTGDAGLLIAVISFNDAPFVANLCSNLVENCARPERIRIRILDNGSSDFHSELLSIVEQEHAPLIEVVRSHRNLGVGGGRNFLLRGCTEEWIAFLDSDISMDFDLISALLPILAEPRVDFYALPLMENFSTNKGPLIPHLFDSVDSDGEEWVGQGTLGRRPPDRDRARLTAIAGGAMVARAKKLRELGGFAGPGLVGYEDVSLSLTLRERGEGIELCDVPYLVHKGLPLGRDASASEVRLSSYELRLNARHLEHQHGVRVWGSTQWDWYVYRHRDINPSVAVQDLLAPIGSLQPTDGRPRVLVFVDRPSWAFARIARALRKTLSRDFAIDIGYTSNWPLLRFALEGSELGSRSRWDLIHFLWRRPLFGWIREVGTGPAVEMLSKEAAPRLIYSVYDTLDDSDFGHEKELLRGLGTGVAFANRSLLDEYDHDGTQPVFYTPDGVDCSLFRGRPDSDSDLRVFGWVGNRTWGGGTDHKGLDTILRPAFARLRKRNLPVVLDVIDRQDGELPHDSVARVMRNWHYTLTASISEGTPNHLLEGLASGLPAISTPVGITRELMDAGAPITVVDRSCAAFEAAIAATMAESRGERSERSRRARRVALDWDWRIAATRFAAAWKEMLG